MPLRPFLAQKFCGAAVLMPLLVLGSCKPQNQTQHAAAASPAATPAQTPVAAAASAPETTPSTEIAWREGSVDEAFAAATQLNKPVLLYWGAKWCPPCNRLKATLFKQPSFIAQTQSFIPVHLDGDSAGAQRWGEYFGIAGYPTLIVLRPDRHEITRLSDGTELDRLPQVLALVLKQNATAGELRDKAVNAPQTLSEDEWTLLASYSWDEDVGPVAGVSGKTALLEKLAAACPIATLKPHFALLALSARADAWDKAKGDKPAAGADTQLVADVALLTSTLSDASRLRADYAMIEDDGGAMVEYATAAGSAERRSLATLLASAMDRLAADESLPLVDRVDSLAPVLDLYHRDHGEKAVPPPDLADKAKALAALADSKATTPFERQAVIADAAQMLDQSGNPGAAKTLLTAELKKSQEPYYDMVELADIAKEEGDKPEAIDWLRKAYDASEGPATRAQWGVGYVIGLTQLAPNDAPAIEQAADSVIDEVKAHPDVYYERTRGRFGRMQKALETWSQGNNQGAATLARLHDRMQGVCSALPEASDARKDCAGWLPVEDRRKV